MVIDMNLLQEMFLYSENSVRKGEGEKMSVEHDKMVLDAKKRKSAFKLNPDKIIKSATEMGFGSKSLELLKRALAVG